MIDILRITLWSEAVLRGVRGVSGSTEACCQHETRDRDRHGRFVGLGLISAVLLTTALVLGRSISIGGFRFGDGAAHAMDGVLILDWLRAGPSVWFDPMAFAERQYGHYPSLGIGWYYPPAFAIVEAAFFAVFGVSVSVARLCVVFFGIIAATGSYVFARRWMTRGASAFGAVSLVTMPAIVTWGRQAMLEIPTLAVLIWTAVVFGGYLDRPTWRRLLVVHFLAAFAVLFKQPSVFLSCAVSITVFVMALQGRVNRRHAVVSVVIGIVVTLATLTSLDDLGRQVVSGYRNQVDGNGWIGLVYYAKQLPDAVGVVLLIAAAVGACLSYRRLGAIGVFLVAWFGVCYVMFTAVDCKTPRFFCIGLFPVAIWAAFTADFFMLRTPKPIQWRLAVATAALALSVRGFVQPVFLEPDYGAVVEAHGERIRGRAVLFSGIRDGDFVFAVREHLPWRSAVVVRGSKMLYSCNAVPEIQFASTVSSSDDVGRILRRYGFRFVFLEHSNRTGVEQDRLLREYLAQSNEYRLVDSSVLPPAHSEHARCVTIDVYEAIRPPSPTEHMVEVYIPRTRHTIQVDLNAYQRL